MSKSKRKVLNDILSSGQPYNISLKFTMAPDYPLDLYYLMDVSNSMLEDKKNLVHLAGSLATESKISQ